MSVPALYSLPDSIRVNRHLAINRAPNPTLKLLLLLLLVGGCCAIAQADTINEAIHRGDIATVQRMLRSNPRLVAFRGTDSSAPLHWAAWEGRADIAKLLIAGGANVNDQRSLDGGTPLWVAAWLGHTDVVKLLLQNGADPEILGNDGNTPLHKAAAYDHTDTIAQFHIVGQNIDTVNKEDDTPLGVAAMGDKVNVAKFLIAVGADIHHRNRAGQTITDLAITHQHDDIAAMIRDYQAGLDERAARELARTKPGVVFRTGYQNWGGQSVRAKEIYTTTFAGTAVGPEWSTQPLSGAQQGSMQISVTPAGQHRFLGEFGSQAVRLALQALPPHTLVSLAFDLYIIRTWDGNSFLGGPDIFTLDVAGGLPLLHTTFQNPSFADHGKYLIQAYPGEYPGSHYRPRTGAVEVDKLGFPVNVDGISTAMDAVYEISYTFSHTSSELAIEFAAHDLEALDNESWGIANVQVTVANDVPTPVLARHATTAPVAPTHSPTRAAAPMAGHRASQPKSHAVAHRSTTAVKKPSGSHPAPPAARLHPKEKPPGL
jgi:ankyrin repeat protein